MKYEKSTDATSMPAKYLKARVLGKSKTEACREAGYADNRHVQQIERTKTFTLALEEVKNVFDTQIAFKDVITEHIKNIMQDIDKSSKNAAIKLYYQINGLIGKEKEEIIDSQQVSITMRAPREKL
ncbi:MAG: hypothetical protein HY764_01905 [Candidatus Portnoybacteria bacterium]|nr:hypothetical protein [Candidatus Portnoybacteria bacterium]